MAMRCHLRYLYIRQRTVKGVALPLQRLKAKHRRRIVYATAAVLVSGSAIFAVKHLPKADPAPVSATAASMADLRQADEVTMSAEAPDKKAPAAAREKVETYTVAEGDTAGAIAEKFNLSTDSVLASNGLTDDDIISVGQELIIPREDGVIVELQNGDNFWQLGEDWGVDALKIAEANKDLDPGNLKVGDKVLIPGARPGDVRHQLASRGVRPSASRKLSYWPTVGPLTDPFGWRVHPVYGTEAFHDGMDLGVPSGTPIRAAAGGTVVMASRYGGYGLVVRIDHGGGIMTQYAHLSEIDVAVGEDVDAGQHIGYSGNTGVSTGPHLHFIVMVDGTPTDPAPWLP